MILLLSLFISLSGHAAIEAVEFDNPELLERYQSLISELRCTVCQNQNLADSDADLAKDLRRKTEEMLKAGQSDEDVLTYMRERYGDFVLYRPPLSGSTSLLWLGPFVLLFIAAVSVLITIKHKQKSRQPGHDDNANESNPERLKQLERLKKTRDLLND
ncbi:UNVERIFIED_CONTAM: hypothetical protein GTU68_041853 [Idotea baltica]|nr:hypothetical protein [Idotea baltica]